MVDPPGIELHPPTLQKLPGDQHGGRSHGTRQCPAARFIDADDYRMPWVGEHTDGILHDELGLDDGELAKLRDAGIIT